MEKTFENVVIPFSKFMDMFVWQPIHLFIVASAITIFFTWIFWKQTGSTKFIGRKIPGLLILIFKIIAYGFLAGIILFYDFNTKEWSFILPDKILLSTAFVAILAIYEALSNLVELVKSLTEN